MDRVRVLVIDDDVNLLYVVESIFKIYEPGYEILLLNQPDKAFETIEKEHPTIIITDWDMNGLSGIDIIREIRKNRKNDIIPIIMATGVKNSPENLMIALAAGANDFILKPFDNIILVARTRSMVKLAMNLRDLQANHSVILENNNFIRSLIQSLPHPLVYYTTEGVIMGFNDSFIEFTGSKSEVLLGSLIYRHCDAADANLHLKMDQDLIASEKMKSYESFDKIHGKNILFSKTLYYNSLGKPEGIMCVITDLTDFRKAQHEVIENKKRELMSSALRLIQISELNSNLIEQLNSLKPHTNKQGLAIINNLITSYNSQEKSISWEEFDIRFQNVYEDFYKRLNLRFPGLTNTEKKLSAFLRLNLTSKEIAALTFQSSKSVDIARYRLRKKLGLSTDENLVSFLEQI